MSWEQRGGSVASFSLTAWSAPSLPAGEGLFLRLPWKCQEEVLCVLGHPRRLQEDVAGQVGRQPQKLLGAGQLVEGWGRPQRVFFLLLLP